MNPRVRELTKDIAAAEAELKALRKKCAHSRVLHSEAPDVYCGWGISDSCADCGEFIKAATRSPLPGDRPMKAVLTREEAARL